MWHVVYHIDLIHFVYINTTTFGLAFTLVVNRWKSKLCVGIWSLGREFSIYINEMVMPVKYKGILIIYWTRTQVVSNGFCSSVVEHWSSNPEDAGLIPSWKALELHISQLVPVWVLYIMYILTTLEFPTHIFVTSGFK